MKKKIFLTLGFAALIAGGAYAESLTMTTYYPAPFGAYDRLRLVPRADLSGACDVGTIYIRTPDEIRFCEDDGAGNGSWGPLFGVWTQDGNIIHPTDFASNPLIGIGTTTPAQTFVVKAPDGNSTVASLSTLGTASNEQSVLQLFSLDADSNGVFSSGEKGWHITARGNAYANAGQQNDLVFYKYDSGWQQTLLLDGVTGNVSIGGVNEPPYTLYVRGDQDAWQGRYANRAGAGADVYLAHGQGYGMHIRGFTTDSKYTLQLYNANEQTNTFRNNGVVGLGLAGNVGVGTTAPTRKLHVEGDTQTNRLFLKANGSNVGELKVSYSGGSYYATYAP